MSTHYVDTSALVKLVLREAESASLSAWLRDAERTAVTSDLARTELLRAVRRAVPTAVPRARAVLSAVTIVSLSPSDFDAAGSLEPPSLRSLDALHLRAALLIAEQLDSVVTYDDRMAEAARGFGLVVDAPGR